MKRRAALLTAFLACAVAALSIAWLTRRNVSPAPTEQASFGVIETRQFQARSRIILYDSELNELGGLPLDYATLGCDWNLSPVYDGTLYVIPQGYTTKRDEKTVLGVDLDDLSVTRYSVDQINLYGVCADDDYIFTCSNLNNVSHICRIDRQTGDVTDIGETDTYIESLCLYDGKLYAFSAGSPLSPDAPDESTSWISIYDRDLNLIDTVTTTKLGSGRYRLPQATCSSLRIGKTPRGKSHRRSSASTTPIRPCSNRRNSIRPCSMPSPGMAACFSSLETFIVRARPQPRSTTPQRGNRSRKSTTLPAPSCRAASLAIRSMLWAPIASSSRLT